MPIINGVNIPDRPVTPTMTDPRYEKDRRGNLTSVGKKKFEADARVTESGQQEWDGTWKPFVVAGGQQASTSAQSGEQTQQQRNALNNYLKSGEHRAWEGVAAAGMVGGGLAGRGLASLSGQAPSGSTKLQRTARAVVPALESLLGFSKGAEQYMTRPEQIDDPRGYDLHNAGMAGFGAMGAGTFTGGVQNALANLKTGSADASNNALLPQPAPPAPAAPAPSPTPAPDPRYRGPYRDVTREMAGDLGLKVAGKEAKGATLTRALAHVDNMNADMLRNVAAKIPEIGAGASTSEIRTGVKDLLTRLGKGSGSLPAILAALGIGGAALGADQAEANPYAAPGEDTLTAAPSRGQRIIGGLGRIGDAMRELPGQLGGMAPSIAAHTVGLPAGLAYDAGSSGLASSAFEDALKPYSQRRDEYVQAANLQNAQSEDARQAAEMRQQQFASQPRQFPEQQPPIDPASTPPSLQRFVNPGGQTPLGQPGGDPVQGMRPEAPQEPVQASEADALPTQGLLDRMRSRTAGEGGRAEFERALEELAQAFKAHHAAVADHAASRHPQSQNALAR